MKKILYVFFLLFSFLQFTACDGGNVVETSKQNDLNVIEGNISGWNEGNDKIIIFGYGDTHIFGAGAIANNGKFIVSLSRPDENLLQPLSLFPDDGVTSQTLKYSIDDVKGLTGYFYTFQPGQTQQLGSVYKHNLPLSDEITSIGTWFSVQYFYVNKDVNITGDEVTLFNSESNNDYYSVTQSVNLKLSKGWNKVVYRSVERKDNSSVIEVSNIEPEGGNWYYDKF